MIYYIVTDDKGYAHLVEAANPNDAVTSIIGGESVRIANQRDIEAYLREEEKKEESDEPDEPYPGAWV